MAIIISAECQVAREVNNRLEMDIVAQYVGGGSDTFQLNVSNKKHVNASYKTNWVPPPTAAINTITNMSVAEFKDAFTEYGRLLAVKLEGADTAVFDPSDPTNRIAVRGIAFSSDSIRLGANIHCFPVDLGVAATPKCISLSTPQFENFKIVARYLSRGTTIHRAAAQRSWGAIQALVQAQVGQPNELLTAAECEALKVLLEEKNGGFLDTLLKNDQNAIARAVGQGNRPNPNDRPPYRG